MLYTEEPDEPVIQHKSPADEPLKSILIKPAFLARLSLLLIGQMIIHFPTLFAQIRVELMILHRAQTRTRQPLMNVRHGVYFPFLWPLMCVKRHVVVLV